MTRPTRTLTSAAALGLLAATAIASPALAKPSPVVYDALGDSYAAGYGAPAGFAYPELLDGRMKIDLDDFAAVSGAKTGGIPAQLDALDEDTDLVTLSIGGNDIGWGDVVGACLLAGEAACAGALTQSMDLVEDVLPGLLDATYGAVRDAAPDAHVVVTGYARLFSPEFGDYQSTLLTPVGALPAFASVAEQQLLNDGADTLNAVIADVAQQHGFQFVDVTERFTGHGVNAPSPWIWGGDTAGMFHPNTQGYRSYTAAVTAAINPRDLR